MLEWTWAWKWWSPPFYSILILGLTLHGNCRFVWTQESTNVKVWGKQLNRKHWILTCDIFLFLFFFFSPHFFILFSFLTARNVILDTWERGILIGKIEFDTTLVVLDIIIWCRKKKAIKGEEIRDWLKEEWTAESHLNRKWGFPKSTSFLCSNYIKAHSPFFFFPRFLLHLAIGLISHLAIELISHRAHPVPDQLSQSL